MTQFTILYIFLSPGSRVGDTTLPRITSRELGSSVETIRKKVNCQYAIPVSYKLWLIPSIIAYRCSTEKSSI